MLLMMTLLACKDQATLEENERLKVRVGDLERVNTHLESDNEALKATIARLEAAQSASADAARLAPGGKLTATFQTSLGDIHCTLRADQAPDTVANFTQLARGEKEWTNPKTGAKSKKPLYDGTIFHRVIPGFMIQGGDPLGNGTGGPGYEFADEVGDFTVFDHPGILAMANAGPDTNGSQFFITEGTPSHLNGKHSIFGDCTDLDVVKAIATAPTGANDRPVKDVVLTHVEISGG